MRIPLLAGFLLLASVASSAPLTLTVPKPETVAPETFNMGTARNPAGSTISLDRRSLLLDGKPWTPVMGEFHYSRYPANEWRQELLKMKAGGIDIVATYVFWIHHEEIEGQWEWTGDKNLRDFVRISGEVGLKVIVRCGPWCHGEVRNGGLPDWIVARGKTRSEDPAFLASTQKLYHHIADQLKGLLWKEGGPVIGIQVDNEYGGPASYLLALKKIARDEGLDVPLYTRTGWPQLRTPMPFGEIIPLYGVYAEGFWDRELTTMPGNYWAGFHFSTLRVDNNIANEALGRRDVKDADDVARYPYLTCEIGGGMMSSYHRRILVDPRDITSTTLVKLGSGSVSPGYYMYHGGTNPEGKLTTLMEEQATAITNWNDMPVKNYDFQTALGQYGQPRPQFYSLRPMHLFLQHFGGRLAGMDTVLPDARPEGKDDTTTLRWAARADSRSGFVFVNNYERGRALPAKEGVQFTLKFPEVGSITLPSAPVTVPADAHFFWPVNFDLGAGGKLAWATAQPIAATGEGHHAIWYFAETPGIPAEFVFTGARVVAKRGKVEIRGDSYTRALGVTPGHDPALILNSSVKIVLLSVADARAFWKTPWLGQTEALLTNGIITADGETNTVIAPGEGTLWMKRFINDQASGGRFRDLPLPPVSLEAQKAGIERVRPAGPLRKIEPGKSQKPVAAAPADADFANAAVWRIKLPYTLSFATNPVLSIKYIGDVARVRIGGKFITDDYYNGNALEIGLSRHAGELSNYELIVEILPLQKDAPIYLPDSAKPDFGENPAVAELLSAEISQPYSISFGPSRKR
jgi:beta-galactosidase